MKEIPNSQNNLITTDYEPSQTNFKRMLVTFWANTNGRIGLVTFCVLLFLILGAPLVAKFNPTEMNFETILSSSSPIHPFGTDDLGRDVLSRVLFGGRETLRVSLFAMSIAISGVLVIGLISGFYPGSIDNIIQRVVEVFLAFPSILLVLSIVVVIGPGLTTVLIALGISSIPSYTRIVRGLVLAEKDKDYVLSARAIGSRDARILFRHILPNILGTVIVYGTFGFGASITITSGLSYIMIFTPFGFPNSPYSCWMWTTSGVNLTII